MTEDTQYGLPPSDFDNYWIKQGDKISPDNSLDRIDTQAKYLFSIVSVVGTLLVGFGVFGPPTIVGPHSPLLIVPVTFVALSLALAMIGTTPRLDNVSPWDIYSIRDHYNSLIKRKGRYVIWASVCFSLSLFSVAAILLASSLHTSGINPIIAVRLSGNEEKASLLAKMEYQHLPRFGLIETQIDGFCGVKPSVGSTILFKDITQADLSGNASVTAELDQVQAYKDLRISCRIRTETKLLFEKTVDIHR